MKPIEKPDLTKEIIERILTMISEGEVEKGDRLPPERKIADNLNVGRSSVREALKSLKVLGILDVKPGGGTYLKNDGISLINNSIEWGIILNEDWIEDLMDVRHLIEPHLARLASQNRTEADLIILKEAVNKMEKLDDFNEFAEEDMHFHIALANASQNRIFSNIVETIQVMLRIWIKRSIHAKKDLPIKYEEHREIYEAILKQDADLAQAAMLYHLKKGNERFWQTDEGTETQITEIS